MSGANDGDDRPGSGDAGSNRAAVEVTIAALKEMGRIETVDAAKVQAVRSIADALDRRPSNSQMWREYREALEGLIAGGDDDEGIARLLEDLRAPVRNPSTP